jgi:hypothetical protein
MMSNKVEKSITCVLDELQVERQRIEGAIARLEGSLNNLVRDATAATGGSRRGRPKGTAAQHPAALGVPGDGGVSSRPPPQRLVARQRSRAGWTQTARLAAAERMRTYWAKRHSEDPERPQNERSKKAAVRSGAANDSQERSRKGWTPDAREAARERMRSYWQGRKAHKVAAS